MVISGLQKTTLIDYPGKIACIVFLAGCNFRCPWCYSSELVLPLKIAKQPRTSEQEFFNFLRGRQGLLEGVVICGGEPTINKDLDKFIEKIKVLGYAVKLDTNGSNPEMLKNLVDLRLIDYVAMDIKTTKEKYGTAFKTQMQTIQHVTYNIHPVV
jgi:pyruvate formate lyase activating enzyme